jgi:hypothetical protein
LAIIDAVDPKPITRRITVLDRDLPIGLHLLTLGQAIRLHLLAVSDASVRLLAVQLANLRLLTLHSIGLRHARLVVGVCGIGGEGWTSRARTLLAFDTSLAFDARRLALDAYLLTLRALSLLALHARRLLTLCLHLLTLGALASATASSAAVRLRHLHLGLAASAAATVSAATVRASIGRGRNRQRGNARGEEYPGHEIISFRTA